MTPRSTLPLPMEGVLVGTGAVIIREYFGYIQKNVVFRIHIISGQSRRTMMQAVHCAATAHAVLMPTVLMCSAATMIKF